MVSGHPVHFRVEAPTRVARIQVVIRLALLLAIGAIGTSSVYWLLYLALPALVAIFVLQRGGDRYIAEAAPRMVRVLRWLAGAYAYLWLLTDALPTADPGGPVTLDVDIGGQPTATSALTRLVYSLPALLLAAVLAVAAGLLWLIAAIVILVNEHLPQFIADFLAMTLRYQTRLIAYHLSLVERYPSLEDSSTAESAARTA